ncbi:MAG: hypothetical protein ACFFE4_14485 [Candidatus Thorarchaeota archaeon]
MDPLNLIKIIAASVTVIFALAAGFIELRLNPKNWLNRWFALFFITGAMGFFLYTLYHALPLSNFEQDQLTIIPIMITAQLFFNLIPLCLVMTVFVLEKYQKIAMNITHLGIIGLLFIVMSTGYFIPPLTPRLDAEAYAMRLINTETPALLQYPVNILRMILAAYVVVRYALISRKVENETRKRVQWFFGGVIIIIIGLIFNLIGGTFNVALIETLIELVALLLLDIGFLAIVKGFLI